MKTQHVDQQSKKLGHYKSGGGLVGMDKQKPRDHSMYYLSEKTNLKQMDKALRHCKQRFEMFDHRVLNNEEIKDRKKLRRKKARSKEQIMSQIWAELKIPINSKVAKAHAKLN